MWVRRSAMPRCLVVRTCRVPVPIVLLSDRLSVVLVTKLVLLISNRVCRSSGLVLRRRLSDEELVVTILTLCDSRLRIVLSRAVGYGNLIVVLARATGARYVLFIMVLLHVVVRLLTKNFLGGVTVLFRVETSTGPLVPVVRSCLI